MVSCRMDTSNHSKGFGKRSIRCVSLVRTYTKRINGAEKEEKGKRNVFQMTTSERWTNCCRRLTERGAQPGSHSDSLPPPPVSPHLSTITPFQHRSISLHHFISGQITYKPPFIHLSLSISAVALSLPICSSISPPSGAPQSAGSILFCQRERAPLCISVSHT